MLPVCARQVLGIGGHVGEELREILLVLRRHDRLHEHTGLARPCVVGAAQFIKDAAIEPILAAGVVGPLGCGAAVVGTWSLLPCCIQASLCLAAAPTAAPASRRCMQHAIFRSSLFVARGAFASAPIERRLGAGSRSATGCAPLWLPPGAHPTF